ncbi:MAG TPA: hypothetical protein DGT21_23660 [Armatimonadetes bacterium]|nr:hypothetical protein [Armatimonadota bacterium]
MNTNELRTVIAHVKAKRPDASRLRAYLKAWTEHDPERRRSRQTPAYRNAVRSAVEMLLNKKLQTDELISVLACACKILAYHVELKHQAQPFLGT